MVDVNYGGSTGYGRAYRERLRGNWGIVDTIDCINAARYLVARGDVDPARVAIQGGSAGGYTTLNALTRHRFFAAGASYFGLADLEVFASGGTHKFESQYLTGLIGPYPELAAGLPRAFAHPARRMTSRARSSSCRGSRTPSCRPLRQRSSSPRCRPTACRTRISPSPASSTVSARPRTSSAAQEAVLSFYGRVFGFTPADDLEPLRIENLD